MDYVAAGCGVKDDIQFQLHLLSIIHSINRNMDIQQDKGFDKMRSGVNIDCNYVINVKQLMKRAYLPRPRLRRPNRKLLDVDGSRIPLIIL